MNIISKRIKEERENLNLTQEELAKKVNKSSQVISNWERGYTPNINNEDLSSLALVLNVSTDYLLGRSNERNLKLIVKETPSNYQTKNSWPEGHELIERAAKILDNDDKEYLYNNIDGFIKNVERKKGKKINRENSFIDKKIDANKS